MAADGSFPLELARTKPYGYSIFQLDNMVTLCQVLSTPTDNLWGFELPDGRGIRKAIAYLYPFLADKSKWPLKPDVQAWEGWPAARAASSSPASRMGEKPYLVLWQRLPPDPTNPEVQRNIAIAHQCCGLSETESRSHESHPRPHRPAADAAGCGVRRRLTGPAPAGVPSTRP